MSSKVRDESDLATELLSTGAFHCAACKQLLQPPVWLTFDKRNLCDGCHRKRDPKHFKATENTPLRLILNTLRFPCPHRSKGCEEMLDHTLYQQHLSACPHNQPCLLAGCQWRGRERQLMMHLLHDHKDIELKDTNDDGVFPLDLNNEDAIQVIHTWLGRFIVRIKKTFITVHVMIYSRDIWRETEGHFVLRCPIGDVVITHQKCQIACDIDQIRTFDPMHVTTWLNVGNVQLIIKRQVHLTVANATMQSMYRCRDCRLFIKARVRECPQGHHVCARCTGLGHKCRSSNQPIPESAMRLLKFLPKGAELDYLFPCIYEGHGCRMRLPLRSCHVQRCDFREVGCPHPRCKLLAGYGDLSAHVREVHTGNFECGRTYTGCSSVGLRHGTYLFFICYGEVFFKKFSVDSIAAGAPENEWYVWGVSGSNGKEFVFTVELCTEDESKRISVSQTCGVDVRINKTMLGDFIEDDEIVYTIRIDKRA